MHVQAQTLNSKRSQSTKEQVLLLFAGVLGLWLGYQLLCMCWRGQVYAHKKQ